MKSLPHPHRSQLDVKVRTDAATLTGTWTEYTPIRRKYHGACQFLLAPTCDSADGFYMGFSRKRGVLAYPWTLKRVADDVKRRTRKGFAHRTDLAWEEPTGGPVRAIGMGELEAKPSRVAEEL
jgi:hypothetical protein